MSSKSPELLEDAITRASHLLNTQPTPTKSPRPAATKADNGGEKAFDRSDSIVSIADSSVELGRETIAALLQDAVSKSVSLSPTHGHSI